VDSHHGRGAKRWVTSRSTLKSKRVRRAIIVDAFPLLAVAATSYVDLVPVNGWPMSANST
jgi:hypothetical protein